MSEDVEWSAKAPHPAARPGEGDDDPGADDDAILDRLQEWEERYRQVGDAASESLDVADPDMMVALLQRIERQKRLYEFLKIAASSEEPGGATHPRSDPDAGRLRPDPPTSPAASGSTEAASMRIGRYRVLRVLGQGGYGRVYLAHDPDLQREVAIKTPIVGEAARFLDVEAYLREARTVARLSHPNIVPVYDVGKADDGLGYVVSRYMEGGDLKARLERGLPTWREAAELVATLGDALQYSHTQDLFHRDIKPANILLDADGIPSLADFGLALRDADVGRGAGYLGTTAYMSPEQARGEGHRIDGRSDIFSLGIVLYELLVGRRPFRGRSHREIMDQVIHSEPRPPRQIDGSIPAELERICLKAMAKRASERYSAARDLADDLRERLHDSTPSAAPRGARPSTGTPGEPSAEPPAGASDSGSRPIRIVPKGLGSFDEHDAEFFPELLPGPRDREGLPEALRFWKARVESSHPDRNFRVGLIYGPSGCGKSSMVKAGLIPRLSPHIRSVHVESAGGETGVRLRRGLARMFPDLPPEDGLLGWLMAIRLGRSLPPGGKLLLVLDQFEQHLFAPSAAPGDDLIAALRQCDGDRVQALCLVRDDFWMAATRFMQELDIDLVPGRNVAAVDLFEPRHARKVLAAYGRAYEALPSRPGDLARDHESFLDRAVDGLTRGGRIVPVHLSMFAEMVKARPWTPATLREVGGMDGAGVRFLEDALGSPWADPGRRYHLRAAQAVLKALLPGDDADIKGRMRTIDELRDLSGYRDRPADFGRLIRMLDVELRLITPVDPGGSDDDGPSPPAEARRSYQLTHDVLVHPLRDWLGRKQRETRRGRAELLLAERASLWTSRREDRYLPSVAEWGTIRLLTRPRDWDEAQRTMMRRTGRTCRRRLIVGAVAAAGMLGAGLAIRLRMETSTRATQARALVRGLLAADTVHAPSIIRELRQLPEWAVPALERSVREWPDDSIEKLHASLALLPTDSTQVEYLWSRLLVADPTQAMVLRDALQPHRAILEARLWRALREARPSDAAILPVASVLAAYDRTDDAWSEVGDKVAHALVGSKIDDVVGWREALQDIRSALVVPLAAIFRETEPGRVEHEIATELLVHYAADRPDVLVEVLLDADPKAFSAFFEALAGGGEPVIASLRSQWDAVPPSRTSGAKLAQSQGDPSTSHQPAESPAPDRISARRARAAMALLRLGHTDELGRWLVHSPRPDLRSRLITSMARFGVSSELLSDELEHLSRQAPGARSGIPLAGRNDAYLHDPTVSRCRALLLALAEYPREAIAPDRFDPVTRMIGQFYSDHDDAGIHAAAGLVLERWGCPDRRKVAPGRSPAPGEPIRRRWYVDREGQTMVLVDGPVVFDMGSPESDPTRQEIEPYHRRTIPRRFAIGSKEVTIAEYQRFAAARRGGPTRYETQYASPPDGPQINVAWYDAAEYCDWLSEQEGLPTCYRPNPAGRYAEGMGVNAAGVGAGGYRLPTQAEWEYACRAGTATSRYFGDAPDLLGSFEWFQDNAGPKAGYRTRPCGRLLPNDLGLFDVLGNVMEWCQDRPSTPLITPGSLVPDDITGETVGRDDRIIRGSSFGQPQVGLRSAAPSWIDPDARISSIGFRVARTIP